MDPTCSSDPGKVTDAEYKCDPDSDSGGVHSNSGVINHEFALLVDGGIYNGVSVSAIGLTKAVHVFYRAQSAYQTPTTDFAAHANAMAQSCQDLIGLNLPAPGVTSTPPGSSGQSLGAADCNAVQAAAVAVELFSPPTRCNFQPMLDENTPPICPGQKNPSVVYAESFDNGLRRLDGVQPGSQRRLARQGLDDDLRRTAPRAYRNRGVCRELRSPGPELRRRSSPAS